MTTSLFAWKHGLPTFLFLFMNALYLQHAGSPGDTYYLSPSFNPPFTGMQKKLYCGYTHALGIRPDSTLWLWGNNSKGQLGNGGLNNLSSPFQMAALSGITDAAAGYEHTLALKSNGTVWAWGRNSEGELGDATLTQRTTPVAVASLSNVVNLSAGYYHSLAVRNDGTLWTWGQNTYGQLGNGFTFNSVTAGQVPSFSGVVDAAGGEGHSVALKSNGTVWAWGLNNYGQLGDGTTTQRNSPVQVNGISAIAIAAGRTHTLVLKADSTVWAWGQNIYGQLGNGSISISSQSLPVQVSGLGKVVAIAAGEYHSLAVKSDGTVWAWGKNFEGQLGNGSADFTSHAAPVQVSAFSTAITVCAGVSSMGVSGDGSVWAWGSNTAGQFGNGTNSSASTPQRSQFGFTTVAAAIARPATSPEGGAYTATQKVTVSCTTAGAVIHYTTNGADPSESDWVIASGAVLNLSTGTTWLKVRAFKAGLAASEIKTTVYQIGEKALSGYSHSIAIRTNGNVWAWGNNSQGQIGNGSTAQQLVPVQVPSLSGITDAAAGFEHTLALKSNGTVWAWGRNSEGELGDATRTQRSAPVAVVSLSNIVNVAAGYYHSLAIRSDSTIWTWGQNTYGQLGNGFTFNSVTAAQVPSLSGVVDAAGGEGHSVALKSDGTVWTWGLNNYGQLGDGTTTQRNSPVQVNGISAIAIAAGRTHTLALKGDGTVWAWGGNGYGQLGDSTTSQHNTPVRASGLSNVVAIAAGEYHSLALKGDGSIWAWGYNAQGQLGDQSFANHSTPVQVFALTGVCFLSAGSQSLCIAPAAGMHLYWALGNNAYGQLGDSTQLNRNTRVLVHFPVDENNNGLQDWSEVSSSVFGDSDKDGLTDMQELFIYGTNHNNFDINSDGLSDGVNIFTGLRPSNTDTDGDGISNLQELINGTSPILADTDGDGVPDKLDPFPLDRFRSKLPPSDLSDHTPPVIKLF